MLTPTMFTRRRTGPARRRAGRPDGDRKGTNGKREMVIVLVTVVVIVIVAIVVIVVIVVIVIVIFEDRKVINGVSTNGVAAMLLSF